MHKLKLFVDEHKGEIFCLLLAALISLILIPLEKEAFIEREKMMADKTKDCYIAGRGLIPICYPKANILKTTTPQSPNN